MVCGTMYAACTLQDVSPSKKSQKETKTCPTCLERPSLVTYHGFVKWAIPKRGSYSTEYVVITSISRLEGVHTLIASAEHEA